MSTCVFGPWTNLLEMVTNGTGTCFFLTNPDLGGILGDTDVDFDNLHVFVLLFDPRFPDFWIFRFLDSQIQGCHLVIFGRGGSSSLKANMAKYDFCYMSLGNTHTPGQNMISNMPFLTSSCKSSY